MGGCARRAPCLCVSVCVVFCLVCLCGGGVYAVFVCGVCVMCVCVGGCTRRVLYVWVWGDGGVHVVCVCVVCTPCVCV